MITASERLIKVRLSRHPCTDSTHASGTAALYATCLTRAFAVDVGKAIALEENKADQPIGKTTIILHPVIFPPMLSGHKASAINKHCAS